jgi:hypothetical protein
MREHLNTCSNRIFRHSRGSSQFKFKLRIRTFDKYNLEEIQSSPSPKSQAMEVTLSIRSLVPSDITSPFRTTTEAVVIPVQPSVVPGLEAMFAHFKNQIRAELF